MFSPLGRKCALEGVHLSDIEGEAKCLANCHGQ